MHEQRILNQLIQAAKLAGATEKILVEVGEFSTISPEHLKEHLQGMVDWEIETRFTKAKIKCACSYKGSPHILEKGHDFVLYACPSCNARQPPLSQGGEIKILGVE